MSFYKQMLPFLDYVLSIRKLKTYLSFDMVFPAKWSLPKSLVEDGQVISFETESQDTKGISLVTEISEKSIEDLLLKIAKVIKIDRKSTRLNSSHVSESRMPSSA